jgi:O-methyltransferase involved in polyketide biosynthesis
MVKASGFSNIGLPDIINIKNQLFISSERYLQVSFSVFDDGWMKFIKTKQVIFVAEGVFIDSSEKDIKSLLLTLKEKFPGSEIVFEVFNSKWLKGWRKKIMDFKLKNELKFGDGASFKKVLCTVHYKLNRI